MSEQDDYQGYTYPNGYCIDELNDAIVKQPLHERIQVWTCLGDTSQAWHVTMPEDLKDPDG